MHALSESILQTAQRIRELKVQGARNIAIAAIEAIQGLASKSKARNRKEFLQELSEARQVLFESRETEPLMRNALRWITHQVETSKETRVKELSKTVQQCSRQFLKNLKDSKEKIAEIGAKRIKDDTVILTHCHSSTVTYLLEKAKQQGRDFQVIVTETRPVFQGRITAQEMLKLGIKTTLIVDSAARHFMNQVDLAIVGADAVTSEGNVVNKIGTSMIALTAQEARTPFYVVTELLKFDPATTMGDYEKIEERNPTEIWKDPPRNLIIRNPAFDVTRRDFIHGIICEEGIISPHSILETMHRKYPWVFE